MSNKKVYLAKHTLASGFDVEYVKSHLSRIPGIVIIESGMGIHPEECQAFVIIPDKQCKHDRGENVYLSKNVYQDLESFLEFYQSFDEALNYVYVFAESSGRLDDLSLDVEKTTPRAFYTTDNSYLEENDEDNYDHFGFVTVELADEEEGERDDTSLLYNISDQINTPVKAYLQVPRHFTPKPEYAVPTVPSLEERKIKQNVFPVQAIRERIDSINNDRRRLLLLRRK